MQCVILAGGIGTRMRPVTERIPKALIPVKDQPFLKHQLEGIKQSGVTDVVLCIGYRGDMIEDYAKDGRAWNLRIRYVKEGDHLRGTAGALRLAFDENALEEKFFVLYGDSYLPIDFRPVWKTFLEHEEPALMTILKNDEKWDNSNACFDGRKITLYEKGLSKKPPEMRFVDYGLCAFQRSLIEKEIASGVRTDLATVLHALSLRGELGGFEVHKRFFEIGSRAGLADFEAYLDGN